MHKGWPGSTGQETKPSLCPPDLIIGGSGKHQYFEHMEILQYLLHIAAIFAVTEAAIGRRSGPLAKGAPQSAYWRFYSVCPIRYILMVFE